jgi:elongation factor 1-gamma
MLRAFNTLEKVLQTRTFLVGERITFADISVAAVVQRAAGLTLDPPTRAKYPSLLRLVETVVNQPLLKDIYGPLELPDKQASFVPPPKETKKKEEKPQVEKAPKAEKPKKKEEEDDEEDDDLIPKEEPKPKNPLDFLPKSSFNLEDWKRAYSNMDTRGSGGSLEWFYEQCVKIR